MTLQEAISTFGREAKSKLSNPGASGARSAFADGNVDRRVESAEVDISDRHLKSANVESIAICLPDAYVDGEPAWP